MPVQTVTIAIKGTDQSTAAAAVAARAMNADLLVLQQPPGRVAETSDGALAHEMGSLAETHSLPLCYAYSEACSGQIHHSLQLVQADGRATANYRSTHLTQAAIAGGLVPGSWLTMAHLEPTVSGERLVLGLLAGIDHLAPEVARALSALGAQLLIAVVDADEAAAADLLGPLARLRAIENGVPILLIEPSGEIHGALAGGVPASVVKDGELATVTIPVDQRPADATVTGMPRRPDLYAQLTLAGRR